MICKVKGILLRINATIHEERALSVLTADRGCITVYAKTGKRFQPDQFYYGEWVLYQTGAGNYRFNSFTLEEPFHALKENIAQNFLAGYFAQIVLHFAADTEQDTAELLSLLLNSLFLLGREKPAALVKSVFELKIMQITGYCPTLSSCGHDPAYFALEDGAVFCDSCSASRSVVPASGAVLTAVSFILNKPPAKAFSFTLGNDDLMKLSRLSESYVLYHMEFRPSALDLWKTVSEG